MLGLYRRPEGDLRVPGNNIDLAFAATHVDVRGAGADLLAGKLRRTGTGAKLRRWVSGGIFIALGVTAATARRIS